MSRKHRSYPYLKELARSNRWRPCSVPLCGKCRRWTTQWCSWHAERYNLYGHPLGRAIYKKEYKPWVRYARRLYRERPPDREILFAVSNALTPGPFQPRERSFVLWRELDRLRQHGISTQEVVTTATGVFLYSFHHPRLLPDDERLTRAIAHAVFKLAPPFTRGMKRPAASYATATLGRRLRDILAPYFVTIREQI